MASISCIENTDTIMNNDLNLTEQQKKLLNDFNDGHNIFLTGPGGCGKSTIIKYMVKQAIEKSKKIQVCALTGCASVLLNCKAKTLHSWAGIGLSNGDPLQIVRNVVSNKYKKKNWVNIDILVIDEVSMMSKKIFEILDSIGKKVKKNKLPFGGIQLICSGDFFQLPPVGNINDIDSYAFCFESELWNKTFNVNYVLSDIFRQTDKVYTKILNEIRIGKLYRSSYNTLLECVNKKYDNDLIKPTILLPKRKDADIINKIELDKLKTQSYVYDLCPHNIQMSLEEEKTNLTFNNNQKEHELNYLKNNTIVDSKIVLKIGTNVMCIANIDINDSENRIVNGSKGIIIDFQDNLPLVKFNNGQHRLIDFHIWKSENIPGIAIKQIPLIYSWAITIHKSQGVSLDSAVIDAGNNVFECGQIYVALSRVKSLDGLYLTNFNPQKIKVNNKVLKFYNSLCK